MAETLDELTLVHAKTRKTLNVIGSLVDEGITYSYSYDGASTITVTLLDPEWALLTSPFFDKNADDRLDAVDVELDGITWRVTQVAPSEGMLTLTFEERPVQWLRFKFGHVTALRDKITRAQFIRRLVKAVRGGAIGFYSRELKDKQAVAKGTGNTKTDADTKDPGVASDADFTIKGQKADSEQRENVSIALRQIEEDNATRKPAKALLVAGIGESEFHKGAVDGVTGTHKGVWQSNQIPPNEVATQAHHFLTGGRSFRAGGAIQAAKDHPDWSAGKIASYVEISDADGSFYDKYGDEADAILKHGGADLPDSPDAAKPYQYAVAKNEDYWTAARRLAEEVNWRLFMHRGVMYFMDDYQLLRGTPQHTFRCLTGPEMVGKPSGEWDHRGNFPQEMTFGATLPRGYLSPGDVVNVTEAGPFNGRWIVAEVSGSWFGPVVNLRLVQPQVPKLEPANESGGSDSEGDGKVDGKAGQVIEKWISISKQNMPYVWGGGHNGTFAPTSGGYDCSGYIGAGLHAGGFIDKPMTSGELAKVGKPGKGKVFTIYANDGHVFAVLENGSGGKYKRADTSPQGGESQRGPHVRENTRSTAGFTPRHFEGY